MNPIQLAIELNRVIRAGRNIYIRCEPEVLDYTDKEPKAKLTIFGQDDSEMSVGLEPKKLISFLGMLKEATFGLSVLGWNTKNLFTYVRYFTRGDLNPECQIFDLKVIEHYLGKRQDAPQSFMEAANRVKDVFKDSSWPSLKGVYKQVYLPLITRVVPDMETAGIWDREGRMMLHPYYDIAGQVNGRLLCTKPLKRCYNPHVIMPEERLKFQPRQGESFIYLDYKHMEISMLQWLSKDPNLAQVMNVEEDLYKVFFKLVSGGVCDTDKKRQMAKDFLLPIIYGQQAPGLAHSLAISDSTAERIVTKIYNLIPIALKWIESQHVNEQNVCTDVHGRKRVLEDRLHRIRDFVVQSPAALVCLEKLVKLHEAIRGYGRIACHIHDGYLLYAGTTQVKMVSAIAKEVLEGDSEMCPGVKLKVTCKTGRSLADLQPVVFD